MVKEKPKMWCKRRKLQASLGRVTAKVKSQLKRQTAFEQILKKVSLEVDGESVGPSTASSDLNRLMYAYAMQQYL